MIVNLNRNKTVFTSAMWNDIKVDFLMIPLLVSTTWIEFASVKSLLLC